MGRTAAIIKGLALALGCIASPALACMPGGNTPMSSPKLGEACSMFQNVDTVWTIGLGEAEDAGGGIVMQTATESEGCGTYTYLVVMNCAEDTATIIGKEQAHVMMTADQLENHGGIGQAQAWTRKAAKQRKVMTPDQIIAAARKIGLDFAITAQASGKIKLMGTPVSLACGCKTYYPGP